MCTWTGTLAVVQQCVWYAENFVPHIGRNNPDISWTRWKFAKVRSASSQRCLGLPIYLHAAYFKVSKPACYRLDAPELLHTAVSIVHAPVAKIWGYGIDLLPQQNGS